MKITMRILALCSVLTCPSVWADVCGKTSDDFITFKMAKIAQSQQHTDDAIDLFCNLAFSGDYRAQFQLAQYYAKSLPSDLQQNNTFAWVWTRLSNATVVSRHRTDYLTALEAKMSDDERKEARKIYNQARQAIRTDLRIDQQLPPLDWAKIMANYEKENGKQEYTGTRIKRDDKPMNLSIFSGPVRIH